MSVLPRVKTILGRLLLMSRSYISMLPLVVDWFDAVRKAILLLSTLQTRA